MNSIKVVNAPLDKQIVKEIHDQMAACINKLKIKKFNDNSEDKKHLILTICAEQMLKCVGNKY